MAAESQELPKKSPQKPEDRKEGKQEAPVLADDVHLKLTPEQNEVASNLLKEITLLYPTAWNKRIDVVKLKNILKRASSDLPGDLGNIMHYVHPSFYLQFNKIVRRACDDRQGEVITLLRSANFRLDQITADLTEIISRAIERENHNMVYALADLVDWNKRDKFGNMWLNKVRDQKMAYFLASLGARDDELMTDFPDRIEQAYEIGKKVFDQRSMAIRQASQKPAGAVALKKPDDRREQKRRVLTIPANRYSWEPPTAEEEALIFEFLWMLTLVEKCERLAEPVEKILTQARTALSRDLGRMYELTPLSVMTDEGIQSLLRAACNEGIPEVINLLKDAGFELDKADLDIHLVAWLGAMHGHCNAIRALADLNNINWNARDDGHSLLRGVLSPEMYRLLASLGVKDDDEVANLTGPPEEIPLLKQAYEQGRKAFKEKRAALPGKTFLMEALNPWLLPVLCTMVLGYISKDFKDFAAQPVKPKLESQPAPKPELEELGRSASFGV